MVQGWFGYTSKVNKFVHSGFVFNDGSEVSAFFDGKGGCIAAADDGEVLDTSWEDSPFAPSAILSGY